MNSPWQLSIGNLTGVRRVVPEYVEPESEPETLPIAKPKPVLKPKKTAKPVGKTCPVCSNPVPSTVHNRTYCSEKCKNVVKIAKDRAKAKAAYKPVKTLKWRNKVCTYCGKEFVVMAVKEGTKYCSATCMTQSAYQRKKEKRRVRSA